MKRVFSPDERCRYRLAQSVRDGIARAERGNWIIRAVEAAVREVWGDARGPLWDMPRELKREFLRGVDRAQRATAQGREPGRKGRPKRAA